MAAMKILLLIILCGVSKCQETVDKFAKGLANEAEIGSSRETLPICGRSNGKSSRIVGGIEANVNEFPWQAWVTIKTSDRNFGCGGTLIHDRWVLTAAQCVYEASDCQVVLGAHHSNLSIEEPNRRVYTSTRIVVHHEFVPQFLGSDIALIELPPTITINDYIKPICLPREDEPDHTNEWAVISGWGYESDDSIDVSPVLRKANVTILPQDDCFQGVPDSIFCSSGTEGRGICDSDRGGPLSVVDSEGTFTQVGILSFISIAGCQSGLPNRITRIRPFLKWISDHIKTPHATTEGTPTSSASGRPQLSAMIRVLFVFFTFLFSGNGK